MEDIFISYAFIPDVVFWNGLALVLLGVVLAWYSGIWGLIDRDSVQIAASMVTIRRRSISFSKPLQ